jgi:hypothetical protein
MSHTALRRVAIRLLHDAELAAAVATDADRALAGLDLTASERAALAAVPPAAWRTDPARPPRVIAALRDEFVATVALAPERAERFLQSPHFHAAVQERGSLALAFGAYMAEDPDLRVAEVARLEAAIATVRRAPRRIAPSTAGSVRRTPAGVVLTVRAGAAALLRALRAGAVTPPLATGSEHVLALRAADGDLTLEPLTDELAAVLGAADRETPRGLLVDLVASLGASREDAEQVVDDLASGGLLV